MSETALIFLDIDGVLNGHQFSDDAQSCLTDAACVSRLNRILDRVECEIVISSAWRYMIHGGAMTVLGFQYMLRTHGMRCVNLIGVTETDEVTETRGEQIRQWKRANGGGRRYVVLDDMDDGISERGLNAVFTNGAVGLTDSDVERAIAILEGR